MARLDLYREGVWKGALVLGERTYLIGRDPDCDLVLEDELASRRHFRLVHRAGACSLEDMDTPNGTMVNRVREFNRVSVNGKARKEHRLSDGDRILLGGETLTFSQGLDPQRE